MPLKLSRARRWFNFYLLSGCVRVYTPRVRGEKESVLDNNFRIFCVIFFIHYSSCMFRVLVSMGN